MAPGSLGITEVYGKIWHLWGRPLGTVDDAQGKRPWSKREEKNDDANVSDAY